MYTLYLYDILKLGNKISIYNYERNLKMCIKYHDFGESNHSFYPHDKCVLIERGLLKDPLDVKTRIIGIKDIKKPSEMLKENKS